MFDNERSFLLKFKQGWRTYQNLIFTFPFSSHFYFEKLSRKLPTRVRRSCRGSVTPSWKLSRPEDARKEADSAGEKLLVLNSIAPPATRITDGSSAAVANTWERPLNSVRRGGSGGKGRATRFGERARERGLTRRREGASSSVVFFPCRAEGGADGALVVAGQRRRTARARTDTFDRGIQPAAAHAPREGERDMIISTPFWRFPHHLLPAYATEKFDRRAGARSVPSPMEVSPVRLWLAVAARGTTTTPAGTGVASQQCCRAGMSLTAAAWAPTSRPPLLVCKPGNTSSHQLFILLLLLLFLRSLFLRGGRQVVFLGSSGF